MTNGINGYLCYLALCQLVLRKSAGEGFTAVGKSTGREDTFAEVVRNRIILRFVHFKDWISYENHNNSNEIPVFLLYHFNI